MQHIASLQSLTETTQSLLTQAANLDDAGLGAMGSDLAEVSGLLQREPALRRTLSEATTAVDMRAGILSRLLTGRIGEPAARIVDQAVRKNWASGADLRDGLGRLGRTAMFLRAERNGDLDEVEDQLFRFGRIVDGSPELSVLLDDPTTPGTERAALVQRLLGGRAHPLTTELLTGLARDTGGRSFSHGIAELVDQAAERKDKIVAVVESAVPLTVQETDRLVAALTRVYSRAVAVHVLVEPKLAGGLRVRVGDEVIDGSVAGRLSALRSRLAG